MGTENGLWLLDRSGQGKVYSLISRRRFQQMDVLEGLNVLITISGTPAGFPEDDGFMFLEDVLMLFLAAL